MLTIITAPNPILSEIAKPIILPETKIAKIDKPILKLIDEMKQALTGARDPEGVGLAAPQIGKSLQLFIIKPTSRSPFQTFINPRIQALNNSEPYAEQLQNQRESVSKSVKIREASKKLEGCLSLKNIWGEVLRNEKVVAEYFDEEGKLHKRTFEGFPAIIIQHEYDHLNGILFPKRVLEQDGQLYKSHKNKKGEDVFEEMEI